MQSLNNKTCIILTFHVIAIDWIKDKEQRNKNNDKNKVYKIYIYIYTKNNKKNSKM